MVYIIHFDTKIHHAQHYIGYCTDGYLTRRINQHRRGIGSRLLQVANALDIAWNVVRTMDGDRITERKLKRRKNTWQICPICTPKINIDAN